MDHGPLTFEVGKWFTSAMAEGVKFEFQMPALRLEGNNLVWVTTNVGEATAEPGTEIDTVQVLRRPYYDSWGKLTEVDATPWHFEVPVNDTVEPGTAHSAAFMLEWPGLEDGPYEAQVSLQQGAHEVWASLNFKVEHGRPMHDHG